MTIENPDARRAGRRAGRRLAPALAAAVALVACACATTRTAGDPPPAAADAPCAAPHVAVRNETRAPVDVYVLRGTRPELLATVSPGPTELPIAAGDREFRAYPENADPTLPGHAYPVTFAVICRGGPAGAG